MHRFIDDLLQILHVDVDVDVDDDNDNDERFVLVSDTALVFNKYRPEQYRRSSSSSETTSLSSASVRNTRNDKKYDRWNANSSKDRKNINVRKEMSDSCLTIPKRSWSSPMSDSCLIIPKRTSWSTTDLNKNNRYNNSKKMMAELRNNKVSIPRHNDHKMKKTNNTDETVSTTTTIERIMSASDDAASSSSAAEPAEPLVRRIRKCDSMELTQAAILARYKNNRNNNTNTTRYHQQHQQQHQQQARTATTTATSSSIIASSTSDQNFSWYCTKSLEEDYISSATTTTTTIATTSSSSKSSSSNKNGIDGRIEVIPSLLVQLPLPMLLSSSTSRSTVSNKNSDRLSLVSSSMNRNSDNLLHALGNMAPTIVKMENNNNAKS